ncbi:hypothetical protein [Actinoplanes sp. GCM10030250]
MLSDLDPSASLFIVLLLFGAGLAVHYFILKAAIRNGVIEAQGKDLRRF